MTLRKSSQVGRLNVGDTARIDHASRYQVVGYKLAEPRRRERVDFVVIGGHAYGSNSGVASGWYCVPAQTLPLYEIYAICVPFRS